jgi:hypothetical protein
VFGVLGVVDCGDCNGVCWRVGVTTRPESLGVVARVGVVAMIVDLAEPLAAVVLLLVVAAIDGRGGDKLLGAWNDAAAAAAVLGCE